MQKLSIFSILIFLSFMVLKAEISFTQHDLTSTFTGANTVDVADADNDGDKDIVGGAFGSGEISWWENDGNRNFSTKHLVRTGLKSIRHLRVADLDNDNQNDLVVTQLDSNKVTIFFSINQNPATEFVLDSQIIGAHTVDLVDFDQDNDLDIIVSASNTDSIGTGEIVWYENQGNRNYLRHSLWNAYKRITFVQAIDLNNDGKNDLLTCDEHTGKVAWLKNNGNNLSFSEQLVDSLFSYAHTVLAKDLDKDGDLDILGAACMSSQIAWWENDGNQYFIKHELNQVIQPIQPQPYGALWLDMADLDNDGDNDLVLTVQGISKAFWLKNDGSQNFTAIGIGAYYSFRGGYQIIPDDIDNDGDVDLVGACNSTNFNVHKITWWKNRLITGMDSSPEDKDTGFLNNYPNPFNPATAINYQLTMDNVAKLTVYNAKGELVQTLVDCIQQAGSHSVNFDGRNLNSGVYVYQLKTGNQIYTRKMILCK